MSFVNSFEFPNEWIQMLFRKLSQNLQASLEISMASKEIQSLDEYFQKLSPGIHSQAYLQNLLKNSAKSWFQKIQNILHKLC